MKLIRFNIKTQQVENEYEFNKDEILLQVEGTLYIVTPQELEDYKQGKIETIDFADASYELEPNEIFYTE